MRKSKYAQEEGKVNSDTVDIEAKIADEVGSYKPQYAIFYLYTFTPCYGNKYIIIEILKHRPAKH